MDIFKINESMFPMHFIETHTIVGWHRFTIEPFADPQEAEEHRQKIIAETKCSPDVLRVAEYKPDMWQKDLIEAILGDKLSLCRLLFKLPVTTLLEAMESP